MKYQAQFDEMRELVLAAKGPEDVQARVVISLHKNFPHYNWAGIYRLEGDSLVLGPFQGKPTVHTRIPVGTGICGSARSTSSSWKQSRGFSPSGYSQSRSPKLETRMTIEARILE